MSAHTRCRVPRWVAVGVPLILGLGAAFCIGIYWPWITRPQIGPPLQPLPMTLDGRAHPETEPFGRDRETRFIGHSEESIVERFGAPTNRWNGHYGLPPLNSRRAYPDAVTFVYERPTGRWYLSFCQQRGKRVCFSATWLPEGAEF
jgi:hypothetical protein